MCGICGIFGPGSVPAHGEGLVRAMTDAIAHRGPDGDGIWSDAERRVVLGHRRLAIIDLSTGQQPMRDPLSGNVIVFNGEIYNYRELKQELESAGCSFATTSDTEVLLAVYREWGIGGLERLNGIFAFGLFDARSSRLVLARDRFGVKPLYYSILGDTIIFASEIKALLKHPSLPRDLDADAVATYLQLRYNPSPQTMLKHVRKLVPGHALVCTPDAEGQLLSFVQARAASVRPASEAEAIRGYADHLEAAIRRQMVSDVPVGLLLSGGIDSAIVGKHMMGSAGYRVKSFTVGFPGEGDFNELKDARRSAELIGTEHYEVIVSEDEYTRILLGSFAVTEEPIAEPTIPALYTVCRLAAEHVKVVLSGQGADEPLGGYRKYLAEKILGGYPVASRLLPLKVLGGLFPGNEVISRTAHAARSRDELGRFLGISSIFTSREIETLVPGSSSFISARGIPERLAAIHRDASGLDDSLSRLLYLDTRSYLSDDLLIFGDKMSMAHSLELRVPFLDNDLVRYVESLPGHYKIRGMKRKFVHKAALDSILPREIIDRKKRGFLTPVSSWLRGGMGELAYDVFGSTPTVCGGSINRAAVLGLLEAHRSGGADNAKRLFALLSLQLWYDGFLSAGTAGKRI